MTHVEPRPLGRALVRTVAAAVTVIGLGGAALLGFSRPASFSAEELSSFYRHPLPAPGGPLRIFHLGHSLVGRDMPAMLAELAGAGHQYDSQLGWGTPLKAHWDSAGTFAGFATENAHPRYRDAALALQSGSYDALVLTEMVEIRDAIRYHDSATYLRRWADMGVNANPDLRVYLYETWHRTDDPEGWLTRIDRDRDLYWNRQLIAPALAAEGPGPVIHVIPAGQVLAAFVRAVAARGDVDGIRAADDLFARDASGAPDPIHLNDLGHYLVALTHYAVLYHRSPEGLPRQVTRADGSPAYAPSEAAALLMQQIVWQVVTNDLMTGVARTGVVQ